jgi:hypothetical protein
VRSRLAWVIGLAGLLALLRRRRPHAAVVTGPDPAEELRRRLDETRTEPPAPEPSPAASADVDDRRREVHEAGRAAVDEMRGPATPE